MELHGEVALITGACSGIGQGIAKVLAAKGVKVGLAARRTQRLQETANEIREAGGEVLVLQMDVADKASVIQAVEKLITQYGRIDILVNNAGLMPASDIDTLKTMNGKLW